MNKAKLTKFSVEVEKVNRGFEDFMPYADLVFVSKVLSRLVVPCNLSVLLGRGPAARPHHQGGGGGWTQGETEGRGGAGGGLGGGWCRLLPPG